MRNINEKFIKDLSSGELSFFLNEVKKNQELCLEIRNGYINIYYRGGNLLKITQKKNRYIFYFDTNYCLNKNSDKKYQLLSSLSKSSIGDYINNFPLMIQEMNEWFLYHPKLEREFQHNLLKANKSIIDIEYQIKNKSRLDMLMYNDKKLIIVENKFGNGAISGKAGLAKHYNDICNIVFNADSENELIQSIVNVSQAKYELGLRDFIIHLEDLKEIEILFLLADYNLNSKKISNETRLIDNKLNVKILFMDKDDILIDYNCAKDLSYYGD